MIPKWCDDIELPDGTTMMVEPGFRISIETDEGPRYVTKATHPIDDLFFARKVDCEMAIAALRRNGLDTAEKILAAGIKRIRRVCIESLQW